MRSSFLLSCLVAAATAIAQAPNRFSYQAIIRDGAGIVQASEAITLGLEVHQTSANGPTVYEESHAVTTNTFGLVNVSVGGGTVVSGSMAAIDWSLGPYFIEVKVDGTSMGTTQLLSVSKFEQFVSEIDGADQYFLWDFYYRIGRDFN